ncbi:MAG TPA: SMC-Scp complex subunit ScpB [Candidatus Paceibacterota bacterium]|nr:SMC-Scp complex subunit ScpB [Candidatus Paceibacterota bacterium]HMP18740.1 SMC-Scp complex subunit ScpB [Candidatus Paceibacterota bacterium]HMP85253.1 SMC-Scp complex subunit ScpB [Candidatus Paceibacterota bacterium]
MENDIQKQIESILFWKGEPVTFSELSKILKRSPEEIKQNIALLSESRKNSGINLIYNETEAVLMTSPQNSEIINNLQKEELSKDLSKAAIETLTIILYRGPISRSKIDYIRGVNSQFIIRNLLVRGLIIKTQDPNDDRIFLYQASTETLAHLGINNTKEIPEYQKVNQDIDNFLNNQQEIEKNA